MPTLPRTLIVLALPIRMADISSRAKAVVQSMTTNAATFPNPTPKLVQVTADIAALDEAETATKTKAKGTVQLRDEKLALVIADLHQLHAYAQQLADANPDHAETIAQSAGMSVRKSAVRSKGDLTAKPGKVSGSVNLVAKAVARRESSEWQSGTDGKTWTNGPPSLQSKTTLVGLVSGVLTYFRHRAVTKEGAGDWSQVVTLVVP